MNKTKQTVSSIIMILILALMSIKQLLHYTNIQLLQSNTIVNDISLILLLSVLTVLVSLFLIYLPLLFVVEIKLHIVTFNYSLPKIKRVYTCTQTLYFTHKIYQKQCVIRCWFLFIT